MKKFSMFSNGQVVVTDGELVTKADPQETAQHLASYLPAIYKQANLSSVLYNPEDGCVYGEYDSGKKVKKQVFARNEEPVDGVQKTVDVPRNEAKAKPETAQITKDRPDVAKPAEVRTKTYEKGKGSENLHSDVVPRSQSNSGLEGKKKTDFEDETSNKATSGHPDTYVQTLPAVEKPAKAGSEANHTAGVKFNSEDSIYPNLKLAEGWNFDKKKDDKDEDEDKKDKKDDKDSGSKKAEDDDEDKADKSDKKDKKDKDSDADEDDEKDDDKKGKKGKFPFELFKKKDASENDLEKEALKTEVAKLRKELSTMKILAARKVAATKYALVLSKLNPSKFASVEIFNEVIEDTAGKLDVASINNATEGLEATIKEAEAAKSKTVTANSENSLADGKMVTSIVIPAEENIMKQAEKDLARKDPKNELKDILMADTRLGRLQAEFDTYQPHQKD